MKCLRFASLFFLLIGLPLAVSAQDKPKAKSAVGIWEGPLKVGGLELRLIFKITEVDGKLSAKLDSPDQGAKDIPLDSVELKAGKLLVTLKPAKASFEGIVSEDGTTAVGEWKQAGVGYPLTVKKVDKVAELKRPQTPKPPYPYTSEDVTFENITAKIKLAGTLTIPKGDGPFPVVVMVTGSGPQDRDETLFEHKPFLVIADHFTRKGIAVLRYDDRGVAKSGGKFVGSTSADFATDAYAAVQYLKTRNEFDPKRIGIAGHSEGGVIAPMVAAEHPDDIGFIVMMAGPGVSGAEVIKAQTTDLLKTSNEAAETVKLMAQLNELIIPIGLENLPEAEMKTKLTAAIKAFLAGLTDAQKKAIEADKTEAFDALVAQVSEPWMNYFLKYDPKPVLQKVKCPVLAINGEFDIQVRAKENLAAIAAALKAGGNAAYKTQEIPGMNHLFQPTKTGRLGEYGKIEVTFDPATLTLMADWILGLKK